MSNRWTIIGGVLIVAVMAVACVVASLKIDMEPKAEKGKRPVRAQTLAEGIKVSRHGLYGVDLVSVGRAHVRKLRKGPFTIGAINELVLEDVALCLPESRWKDGADKEQAAGKGGPGQKTEERGPKAMLSKLGVDANSLKLGGKMPRFSALAIRGLRVSRLEGTNAVPWFAAARGEAERAGLKLKGGFVIENGHTNAWKEALLVFEPSLMLLTRK